MIYKCRRQKDVSTGENLNKHVPDSFVALFSCDVFRAYRVNCATFEAILENIFSFMLPNIYLLNSLSLIKELI